MSGEFGQTQLDATMRGYTQTVKGEQPQTDMFPKGVLSVLEKDSRYQEIGAKVWYYLEGEKGLRDHQVPAHAQNDTVLGADYDKVPTSGEEFAEYLSSMYRYMNLNAASMAINYYRFRNLPKGIAKDLSDGWDAYDNSEDDFQSYSQGAVALMSDPLTLLGFAFSGGLGIQTTKVAGKELIKAQLKNMVARATNNPVGRLATSTALGAAEGGVTGYYGGGVRDVTREQAGEPDQNRQYEQTKIEGTLSGLINAGITSLALWPKRTLQVLGSLTGTAAPTGALSPKEDAER